MEHYNLLGVSRFASQAEIERAFRRKALECHPDKNSGDPRCEELFKKLQKAKYTLIDPAKRENYDRDGDDDDGNTNVSDTASVNLDLLKLAGGHRFSDELKTMMEDWLSEGAAMSFVDNYESFGDSGRKLGTDIANVLGELLNKERNNFDLLRDASSTDVSETESYKYLRDCLYGYSSNDPTKQHLLVGMVQYLRDYNCRSAAARLHKDMGANIGTNSAPRFTAALYILKAFCLMEVDVQDSGSVGYEGFAGSLRCFQEAILTVPSEEVYEAVTYLFTNDHLRAAADVLSVELRTTKVVSVPYQGYLDRLKKTLGLRTIRQYERNLDSASKMSNIEKAMLYVDFTMISAATCMYGLALVNAASCLLKEMEELAATKNAACWNCAQAYALRNAIRHLCLSASVLAYRYEQPIVELHIVKLCYIMYHRVSALFVECVRQQTCLKSRTKSSTNDKQGVLEQIDKDFDVMLSGAVLRLVKVTPISQLPMVGCADMIYLDLVFSEFLTSFFKLKLADQANNFPWSHLYQYQLLDCAWKCGSTDKELDETRNDTMEALLVNQQRSEWNLKQVEELVEWPFLREKSKLWLGELNKSLLFPGKSFHSVEGVVINTKTGDFQLLLTEKTSRLTGLFTTDDIVEIFQNGISHSFLTLDSPDVDLQYHPFQLMKYGPTNLQHTNFCRTLLHADYLLKMISTGSEVCTTPPFTMRDANLPGGFISSLPVEIRNILKPVSERKNGRSSGQAHRFWIEAGGLPYLSEEGGSDRQIFTFAEMSMKIKTHMLKRNANGELVDDEKFDGTGEKTAEMEFAHDMTENYNKIGKFFPIFLRLRELHKLSCIFVIVKSVASSMEKSTTTPIPEKPMQQLLRKFKLDNKRDTSDNRQKVLDSCLRDNDITYSRLTSEQASDIKRKIQSASQEADERAVPEISKQLAEAFEIPDTADLRKTVKEWYLDNRWSLLKTIHSSSLALARFIAGQLQHVRTENVRRFKSNSASLGMRFFDIPADEAESGPECVWVPAVFHKHLTSRIYGGVLMLPKLEAIGNTENILPGITPAALDKRSNDYKGKDMYLYKIWYTDEDGNNLLHKIGITCSSQMVAGRPARVHNQERDLNKKEPGGNYYSTYVNLAEIRVDGATLTRKTLQSWESAQVAREIRKGSELPGNKERRTNQAREKYNRRNNR